MEESKKVPIQTIVRDAIQEFIQMEQAKQEPAYKLELEEERKRREQLERRVNELVEENKRTREIAEETERGATIRTELQKLGVGKVDLAFRAVKDDVFRAEDGRLVARGAQGEVNLKDYLTQFVSENPELLPARIAGGSGVGAMQKASGHGPIDLDRIKPGMSVEDRERVRQEIARIASQSLRDA